MDAAEARIEKLEREFQRSRLINRVLFCAIVGFVGIAGVQADKQAKPSTTQEQSTNKNKDLRIPADVRSRSLEASQIVLRDAQGRQRAVLMVTDRGPELSMFDSAGSTVIALRAPQNSKDASLEIKSSQGSTLLKSSGISVRDMEEQSRLHLSLINGNFPMLGISQSGQNGPPSIEMTANEGTRSLKLHDVNGKAMFSVFTNDKRATSLSMQHPDYERTLQMSSGAKDQDGPAISLLTAANDQGSGILPLLRIGLDRDNQPFVRIVDGDGRPRFTAPSQNDRAR